MLHLTLMSRTQTVETGVGMRVRGRQVQQQRALSLWPDETSWENLPRIVQEEVVVALSILLSNHQRRQATVTDEERMRG